LLFLNDILHQPVYDSQGEKIGTLSDLVISSHETFPVVTGVAVALAKKRGIPISVSIRGPRGDGAASGGDTLIIPWKDIDSFVEERLSTSVAFASLQAYSPRPGEILLARDVLDKQIVDMEGRRIVRVNDLKLTQVKGGMRLLGADISGQAFLRRLLPFRFSEQLVSWNFVAPLTAAPNQVRLTVPQTKLASLHPADLADLIEQMNPQAAADALENLDVEVAADALEEVQDSLKADIVEEMETKAAADVLEAMPADEAADIMGDLPEERAQEILAEMQPEEAAEVKELLQYDTDSAGGVMTSEVMTLPQDLTAGQAINRLRQLAPDAETPYYLFVVDKDEHLLGNVSLRNLVTAAPAKQLGQIMDARVIKVNVDTDQEEVARVIRKYNLMAVPVVDRENRLQGMITLNDVVDMIDAEAAKEVAQLAGTSAGDLARTMSPWRVAFSRLSWLAVAVTGGGAAAFILRAYTQSLGQALPIVFFLPMLLLVAGGFVAQTLVSVGRGPFEEGRSLSDALVRELGLGLLVGAVTGLMVMAVVSLFMGALGLGLVLGVSLAVTLPIAAAVGTVGPHLLKRWGLDPSWASVAILAPLVSVVSVLIYLSLAEFLIQHLV
jgi:magnesium transporter